MNIGVFFPPRPGPHKSIETLEERIEIKAVKHRSNKEAPYLCSDDIEMVRHFVTTKESCF